MGIRKLTDVKDLKYPGTVIHFSDTEIADQLWRELNFLEEIKKNCDERILEINEELKKRV